MRVSLGSVVFLVLVYSVFGSECPGEKDSPVMSWWIGAADLHQDEFLWFSTGEPIKYENFHSGQPSSSYMSDKENCVEILFARGWDYEWNDTKCSNNQRFICEYFERKNS